MNTSPSRNSAPCPNCSEIIAASFAYCPVCGHCMLDPKSDAPLLDGMTPASDLAPRGEISISRDGQVFGPYPRDVVEKWIGSGQLQKHDLGCRDGAEGWRPIGKLLWPQEFASAGSFSRNQWGWVIAAIIAFIVVGALVS